MEEQAKYQTKMDVVDAVNDEVMDALKNGEMTVEYVDRNFILTDEQVDFFRGNGFG